MRDYRSDKWLAVLRHNQLDSFGALWSANAEWVEALNQRRSGWSGVARLNLSLPGGGSCDVFLKRQENHVTRTFLHPFGMPTLVREMRNILRLRRCGVPALEPVYFAQRRADGNTRAILVTEALTGYRALEDLVREWQQHGWPDRRVKHRLMQKVADLMQRMHAAHLQHNCFYPKHVLVRFEDSNPEVRIIDLEKAKWRVLKQPAVFRDLYTLNRRSRGWRVHERLRFFLIYLDLDRLSPAAKRLWRRIARRSLIKEGLREDSA